MPIWFSLHAEAVNFPLLRQVPIQPSDPKNKTKPTVYWRKDRLQFRFQVIVLHQFLNRNINTRGSTKPGFVEVCFTKAFLHRNSNAPGLMQPHPFGGVWWHGKGMWWGGWFRTFAWTMHVLGSDCSFLFYVFACFPRMYEAPVSSNILRVCVLFKPSEVGAK